MCLPNCPMATNGPGFCALIPAKPAVTSKPVCIHRPPANGSSLAHPRSLRCCTRLSSCEFCPGIQPSGALHLGNYFGMMRPAIELQEQGEAYLFHRRLPLDDLAVRPGRAAAEHAGRGAGFPGLRAGSRSGRSSSGSPTCRRSPS